MRRRHFVAALASLFLCSAFFAPGDSAASLQRRPRCGVERWPVKTASDPDAQYLKDRATGRLKRPRDRTVEEMLELPYPFPSRGGVPRKWYTERVRPYETSIVRLKDVRLKAYKLEPDSDYHLVIEDGNGNTMVAEIVHPQCVRSQDEELLEKFRKARADFDARFRATSRYQETDTEVTIVGVPFFDRPHGARGGADNGIEIHPVLEIDF
jgi:hypothetical protein